jgi:hypothetical protein
LGRRSRHRLVVGGIRLKGLKDLLSVQVSLGLKLCQAVYSQLVFGGE